MNGLGRIKRLTANVLKLFHGQRAVGLKVLSISFKESRKRGRKITGHLAFPVRVRFSDKEIASKPASRWQHFQHFDVAFFFDFGGLTGCMASSVVDGKDCNHVW